MKFAWRKLPEKYGCGFRGIRLGQAIEEPGGDSHPEVEQEPDHGRGIGQDGLSQPGA